MSNTMAKIKALRKALRLILNFRGLDLTINSNTQNYGLRFYTLFNRLDAANNNLPVLNNDLLYMDANITVPNGYTARFVTTNRDVILPLASIRAVAFVVKNGTQNMFLRELQRAYSNRYHDYACDWDKDKFQGVNAEDFAHQDKVYEVFVDAIDRSNNPLRGKIVAFDSEVLWIQATDTDTPPTFYLVPIEDISFIAVGTN